MEYTASAILIKNKKILLTKRSQSVSIFPGYWTLPGWRCEESETLEETVIREIHEEVGLKFTPTELFQTSVLDYWKEKRRAHRFLGTYSGNICLQENECDGYAWFVYSEAITLPLAFDYRTVIELLFEKDFL